MPARISKIRTSTTEPRRPLPREVADVYSLSWLELFEAVPTPLWLMSPDAELWFGNRAWHALTCGASDPLTSGGTAWLQAVHEEDRSAVITAFHSAMRFRQRVEVDVRVRSDEGYRWWALVGHPHSTPAGDVEMFVGVANDTTPARDAQQQLRDLGARLVAAQESERARIARELHDDVAQRVALLTAKLGSVSRMRPFSTAAARKVFTDVREMLHELTHGIHLLSCELHPPKLTLLGLGPTIKAFCDEVAESSRLAVRFTEGAASVHVDEDTGLCVFRVMQEALQNAVKHSGGRRVNVRLRQNGAKLTLWVADDGAGFDPALARRAGLGLMTMRERVELVGGRFRIISEPACGTVVEATVPVRPHAPAAS